MKQAILTNYVFNPTLGTLDLSSIPSFDIKKLYAVINTNSLTNKQIIYASGIWQYSYTDLTAGVLTLSHDVSGMSAGDSLLILYDTATAGANGEVAQPFSDLIAGLASDGNQYPVAVDTSGRIIISPGTGTFNFYDEAVTIPDTEVTVHTQTIAPTTLIVYMAKVSCPIEGRGILYVNSVKVASSRTAAGSPEGIMEFPKGLILSIGDELELKFKARANSAIAEVETFIHAV